MKSKRTLLFRIGSVALLLAIAAVMLVIGRGHTVYFDNKTIEYNGQTYEAFHKVVLVSDQGEEIARLQKKDRGMTTCIGQTLKLTLEITAEKGGAAETKTVTLKLPYDLDGIVINLPAYLSGLPEEAYQSEFVSMATSTDDMEEEEIPGGDEFGLGDL